MKALASSVGETVRELKEIVSPKARKKPKPKPKESSKPHVNMFTGTVTTSAPNSYGFSCAPRLPVFTGVGLPSPSSPRKGSSKPQLVSTHKPPPGRHPPAPPEMFDVGSELDEGEEEDNIEHDPVINPDDEDYEGSTYHIKDLREQNLPALVSAAGFRSWKNGVLTQFGSIDKCEARIFRCLQVALGPNIPDRAMANMQSNSDIGHFPKNPYCNIGSKGWHARNRGVRRACRR